MAAQQKVLAMIPPATQAQLQKAKAKAEELAKQASTIIRNPEFQTLTLSTGSGAVVLGTAGGAFGSASGIVVGSAAGLVPALFTFGLSIPAGAVLGGGAGLFIGTTAGGVSGGATGYGLYKYRAELRDGLLHVKVKAVDAVAKGRARALGLAGQAQELALTYTAAGRARAEDALAIAKVKSGEASKLAKARAEEAFVAATTTRGGVACTSAAIAGAGCGVAGGAAGAVAGAAVGVVPALFTFGLSIPVGAALGLCAGTATGASAGAMGGGAAGYAGFTYRKELSSSAVSLKTKAMDSATQVSQNLRAIMRASTGGTA